MRERFRREAELLTRISEAHVAKVYECGVTADGQEYIVMDRLSGEDLATRLRRRVFLPLGEFVTLAERIAVALEAAHAVGVVHRNLKPENVFLLQGSDSVRLLDFGIARFQEAEGLTLTMEVLGTPGYLAPEQVRGNAREIGPHTDVFALGAIAYRALTGKCAFPSRAPAAAVYESLHLTPRPPSSLKQELSEDVDDVIALALAKLWTQRYARPTLFARDLSLAAGGVLGEGPRASARNLTPAITVVEARDSRRFSASVSRVVDRSASGDADARLADTEVVYPPPSSDRGAP